jgi:hypothetical protein
MGHDLHHSHVKVELQNFTKDSHQDSRPPAYIRILNLRPMADEPDLTLGRGAHDPSICVVQGYCAFAFYKPALCRDHG